MKLVGNKEFGTWKNGSSIYKDSKGYYVVAVKLNAAVNEEPMYKKYLKGYKPKKEEPELCFVKKRWTFCNKKKANKTRKRHSK